MRAAIRRISGIAGLALLGLCSALPAQANGFDIAQRVCFAGHGDLPRTLALADANGLQPITGHDAEVYAQHFPNAESRFLRNAGSLYGMLLKKITSGAGTYTVCDVISRPPEPASLNQVKAWASVDSVLVDGHQAYLWREKDGRHIQLTLDEARANHGDPAVVEVLTRAGATETSIEILWQIP